MGSIKFWWRKIFSTEYKRADYECEEVFIRNDKYRLVKYKDQLNTYGKWCLFDPKETFIDRTASKSVPFYWANNKIKKYNKD